MLSGSAATDRKMDEFVRLRLSSTKFVLLFLTDPAVHSSLPTDYETSNSAVMVKLDLHSHTHALFSAQVY